MGALHLACFMDLVECVKLYTSDFRCTADVLNMKNQDGDTALMVAVYWGNLDCVRLLAELPGTDFRARARDGKTLEEVAVDDVCGMMKMARNHTSDDVLKYLKERKRNEARRSSKDKPKREKICWNCISPPSPTKKLYRCASCMVAWYCGEVCQREDRDRHEGWCEKKVKKRSQRNTNV